MGLLQTLFGKRDKFVSPPGGDSVGLRVRNTEQGSRATLRSQTMAVYRQMHVDPELYASIMDIRVMQEADSRVRQIHRRTARSAAKGGLVLKCPSKEKTIHKEFARYTRTLRLNRREKLESDIRGIMMEGNLCMQWVVDRAARQLQQAVRMPTETILPQTNRNGVFRDVSEAYHQLDPTSHSIVGKYGLWQMSVARLEPENYDDWGSFGRPYLHASRGVWKKLCMTEEDLVLRRRMRAPLRLSHVLEGAEKKVLDDYRAGVEADQSMGIFRDFFTNMKSSVTAIEGDSNLGEIADIAHLLDTFYAGSPAPKGLFGYTGDLSRDILADLKQDYFEEVDAMQDLVAGVYEIGFHLHLLLRGIDPDLHDHKIDFKERRTETRNQRADLALKYKALGMPHETVWRTAGEDPAAILQELKNEFASDDPYPNLDGFGDDEPGDGRQNVSITPGNAPKGESATSITND